MTAWLEEVGVLRPCPPQGSSGIAIFQPRRCAVSTFEPGWEGAQGAIGPAFTMCHKSYS